jgi:hypothetical protein
MYTHLVGGRTKTSAPVCTSEGCWNDVSRTSAPKPSPEYGTIGVSVATRALADWRVFIL